MVPKAGQFDGLSVPARRVLGGHRSCRRRVGLAWLTDWCDWPGPLVLGLG